MPQSQPGRTAQAGPPAAEQDSRSHSPPTPALALSNLGLLLCRGMKNITLSARFVGVGGRVSQNRGQCGPFVNSLGNCDKADLTDHRADLTSTCSILRIFRIPRRGRHVHSTQCVHWCLVGVPILSQVTAVFTLASFAPAQSIDQGWRLSGAANP